MYRHYDFELETTQQQERPLYEPDGVFLLDEETGRDLSSTGRIRS